MKKKTLTREEFVCILPKVMDDAGRLGLWKTYHALHEVVRVAGWELADSLAKTESKKHERKRRSKS